MIAFLKGTFTYKSPALVHMDVNGLGYEVQISLHTYSHIQALDQGMLHTVLIVREDAHLLFGFFDVVEKEMFQLLLAVSGIGAGTARVMLSYMKPEELARAIQSGDVKALESIKGIGRKTAERVILELRDKLSKQTTGANISPMKNNTLQQDAFNALTALGINRAAAEQAIKKALQAEPGLPVEELIKKALRIL